MANIDQKQLYQTLSKALGVPLSEINDDSSPDTIEKWDSLTHLNLILALEAEFNVSFTPEDTMEMLSVKLINMILEERLRT